MSHSFNKKTAPGGAVAVAADTRVIQKTLSEHAAAVRARRRFKTLGVYVAVAVVFVLFMIPIYLVVTSSIKPSVDIFSRPPKWIFRPTADHYNALFTLRRFHTNVLNSIEVALGSTVISILVGSLAAHALARLRIKSLKNVSFWILSIRMFPPISVVIPYYILLRKVGLFDTPFALMAVYCTFNIPLAVWMMKGFFQEIPAEMEEAALVDGCNYLSSFFRVALPLAAPGIVVSAVFCFIFSWNEFLFAFMLTSSKTMTATVAVMGFWSTEAIEWGRIMAGSVVVMFPIVVFVFLCQKYMIKGLTLGSIK